MQKIALYLALAAAVTGLMLFIPWPFLSFIFYIHVIVGIGVAVSLAFVITRHVRTELFNPFRQGFKKWNGFKLFLYLSLAVISGAVLLFYKAQWLIYFHLFIGLWSMLVSWKHTK